MLVNNTARKMNKQQSKTKTDLKKEKQDRLSQALKDNLKRRKLQAKKTTNKPD